MKKKIMGLWIACLCAVSMLLTGTVSHAEVIHETDLEKYILEEMSAAHVLGMSISIVNPNKELYCAAYGQAQNTDMDYVLGGTTKSLTATAILHMAEVKDLTLDDTVADYLPDYQAVGNVTIRELLYQTSGISPEERMSNLQGLGTRGEFADANANYNLLGMIIEKVSDISYEEYISDTILDTLEMQSTYSKRNDTGTDGTLLPAYQGYFGFPFATQYEYDKDEDWMQVPAGQMISDVKDIGKYLQLLLNHGGELLLGSSVKQLLYGDVPVADTKGKMFGGSASGGMGWLAKEVDGQPVLYSSGITENYSTAMVLLPEKDLGIVMMFNSTDFLVGQQLINKLQEGIVSIELEKEPEPIDKDVYMTYHGVCDAIMVLLVLAAWMPILLMGVWCRHRRKKLLTIPGIVADILIQLVLPTAILLILPEAIPIFWIKRMTPDIYYVGLTIILTLYLGAIIKIIAMAIIRLLPPQATEEATVTEETASTEIANDEIVGTVKAATTRAKRDRMLETVRTGVLEKEDMITGKTEKPVTPDKTAEPTKAQAEPAKAQTESTKAQTKSTEKQNQAAENPAKNTENQNQTTENPVKNTENQNQTAENPVKNTENQNQATENLKKNEENEEEKNAVKAKKTKEMGKSENVDENPNELKKEADKTEKQDTVEKADKMGSESNKVEKTENTVPPKKAPEQPNRIDSVKKEQPKTSRQPQKSTKSKGKKTTQKRKNKRPR